MKLDSYDYTEERKLSLPSRGAWIEISRAMCKITLHKSLPSRGAWIEMFLVLLLAWLLSYMSLPSRGAWIEIATHPLGRRSCRVAPLTGSVD